MLRTLFVLVFLGVFGSAILTLSADTNRVVSVWKGCDGTVVERSNVGELKVTHTEKNLPGCNGPRFVPTISTPSASTGNTSPATGSTVNTGSTRTPTYNPETSGPLLDITQADIVNHRIEKMRADQIRYANALYSLRMRAQATKKSETVAYLIKNDALVITGSEDRGWVKAQGADVRVTDARENTVGTDTEGKADGYVARKYIRNPDSSDLVRIGQADQAYWSDVSHVRVAHLVNVRQHPWYGARILQTIGNNTNLYVISTVNNWSEVMSDDGAIRGYIRSDFIVVDKAQRVEPSPFL
jgi:hypothetical protein